MAPIRSTLESLEDLDESLHSLYLEKEIKDKDGKPRKIYEADIENPDSLSFVAPLRNAHEAQKKINVTLKAENAELRQKAEGIPADFSLEEWERLKAVDAELKKNPDDPEKKRQHEAEIQSVRAMNQQTLDRMKVKHESDVRALEERLKGKDVTIRRLLVEDGLTKALADSGISKHYLKAARAMLEKSVKMSEDNGVYTAVIETDLGEEPIDKFVPVWAQSDEGKAFVTPARGADASGSDSKGGKGVNVLDNPYRKSGWNMTQQSAIYRTDSERANRLAKIAGHKDAVTARFEGAH